MSPAPASLLLLLLLGAAAHVPGALGLRCYVCVPRGEPDAADVLHVFPGFPARLACEHFAAGEQGYQRDCPRNYTSCSTVTDGGKVMRTCSDLPVSDCKMANGVEYCYCKEPLCNGAAPATSSAARAPPPPPSDDEDLEGSGGGAAPEHRPPAKAAPPPPTTPAAPASGGGSPLHRSVTLAALLLAAPLWAR
ncbi:uncharacterized protein LOC134533515 [Bacillus rossius redtenbacheri]|uniref:uncharacterized protein LOC134533515 n=1 Tax=Bacillus rossius redtenbacheri TaxID=93214 RepID=UPI002FDE91CE